MGIQYLIDLKYVDRIIDFHIICTNNFILVHQPLWIFYAGDEVNYEYQNGPVWIYNIISSLKSREV